MWKWDSSSCLVSWKLSCRSLSFYIHKIKTRKQTNKSSIPSPREYQCHQVFLLFSSILKRYLLAQE